MKSLELYEYISTQLDYDQSTGLFAWNSPRANNKIQEGDRAGSLTAYGYINITFTYEGRTRSVMAHRLAYYMCTGELPRCIDHANGNKVDNCAVNLRKSTYSQNRMNANVRSDNVSKVTGVYWRKDTSKWRAEITKDGVRKHLGLFETKEEAIKARKDAEAELFGEFSADARKDSNIEFKPKGTLGKSGVRWVTWHKGAEKWQAKPIMGGTPISLGLFDTVEEASAKVESWKKSFDAFFSK